MNTVAENGHGVKAGPDRRGFLRGAAAALVSGPAVAAVATQPGPSNDLEKMQSHARKLAASELNTSLRLLVGVMQLARSMADSLWQQHGSGSYCGCRGCAVAEEGLMDVLDRHTMILLDIAIDGLHGDIAGPALKLKGETWADDLQKLAAEAKRADAAWDAERDGDGNAIPWAESGVSP